MSRLCRAAPLILVASALLAGGVQSAGAQGMGGVGGPGNRLVKVVVSGGLTIPSGGLKDFHDNGFHIDGSVILNIPGFPVTIRPELSYSSLKFKPAVDSSVGAFDNQKTQLLSGLGNIEVPLAGGLYVIGGIGAMNIQSDVSSTTDAQKQTNLFLNAGAGVRFNIGSIAGFLEARLGTASYDKGKFGYSKAQLIPVSFGLVF